MNTRKLLLLAGLCLSLCATTADDVARHKAWMDTAQDLKDDLQDALEGKAAAKANLDAAQFVDIGKQEEQFWKDARVAEAVELAKQNLTQAQAIVETTKAGKVEGAIPFFEQLNVSCRACHDLHPEKRIKIER